MSSVAEGLMRGLASWFSLFTGVIASADFIHDDYEYTQLETVSEIKIVSLTR
jgi:hypothetical protein